MRNQFPTGTVFAGRSLIPSFYFQALLRTFRACGTAIRRCVLVVRAESFENALGYSDGTDAAGVADDSGVTRHFIRRMNEI